MWSTALRLTAIKYFSKEGFEWLFGIHIIFYLTHPLFQSV